MIHGGRERGPAGLGRRALLQDDGGGELLQPLCQRRLRLERDHPGARGEHGLGVLAEVRADVEDEVAGAQGAGVEGVGADASG